jgi:four helix bundle protein
MLRPTRSYRDLIVWQKAYALARDVYALTMTFPDEERFGLASQMRRSSTSIASNIAEGYGRATTGEFINQLSVARGSLYELQTEISFALDFGFLAPEKARALLAASDEVGALLWAVSAGLRRKQRTARNVHKAE